MSGYNEALTWKLTLPLRVGENNMVSRNWVGSAAWFAEPFFCGRLGIDVLSQHVPLPSNSTFVYRSSPSLHPAHCVCAHYGAAYDEVKRQPGIASLHHVEFRDETQVIWIANTFTQ